MRKKNFFRALVVALCVLVFGINSVDTTFATIDVNGTYSKYTGKTYIHNERYINEVLYAGVDVSSFNGTIDWKKVKADGIEFAFIRCGFRTLNNGRIGEDPKFKENLKNAKAAGIQVGVYFFSQATSVDEAKDEAAAALSYIGDEYFSLPIVIDYEYGDNYTGYLANANLSKSQQTEIINAFAAEIKKANFVPMLYSNPDMLWYHLNPDDLTCKLWLANWNTKAVYKGDYSFWQYNCTGKVDGITGNVDVDFWYSDSNHVRDGLDYSPVFNASEYLAMNPDLRAAFGNDEVAAFNHFLKYGMNEGRMGCYAFNAFSYRGRYPDLQNWLGKDIKQYYYHYLRYGQYEGRNGSYNSVKCQVRFISDDNVVSEKKVQFGGYLEAPTISKSGAVFDRWIGDIDCITSDVDIVASWKYIYEGVDYTPVFNPEYYMGRYSDINKMCAGDGAKALEHFVKYGMQEGRRGNEEFDPYTYRAKYNDLQWYGDNMQQYYYHFLRYGINEKRNAIPNDTTFTVTFWSDREIVKVETVKYGHSAMGTSLTKTGAVFGGWDTDFSVVTGNIDVNAKWEYWYDGVNYTAIFDADYYLSNNSDLAWLKGDRVKALEHFLKYGINEGRRGCASFDVFTYRAENSDLQYLGDNLWKYYNHYLKYGINENRTAIPNESCYTVNFWSDGEIEKTETVKYGHSANCNEPVKSGATFKGWDSLDYKVVKNNLDITAQWEYWYNGIEYSCVFDPKYYLSHNPDLARVYGDNYAKALEHFVKYGMSEGRQGSEEFCVQKYKERCWDLSGYGDDLTKYYYHYIYYGKKEGRRAN